MRSLHRMALVSSLAAAPAGAALGADSGVSPATVRTVAAALTTPEMDGRAIGTTGHAQAQQYLVTYLSERGYAALGAAAGSYLQPFAQGANILAQVPGPSGAPRILISAHYDHLGHACRHVAPAAGVVCNGAADDAAGVAVVLAAAEALAQRTAVPVALALWDAEESGLLGSAYFLTAPTFDAAGLRLVINMDVVGLDLFTGMEASHFAIGAETGGAALQEDVRLATAEGLRIGQLSYAFGHQRSDLTSFVAAGKRVPFVLFSDGDGTRYHTNADDFGALDLEKVRRVADTVARLAMRAAASADGYAYAEPRHVGAAFLPLFADAVAVDAVLRGLAVLADANGLSAAQRADLQMHAAKVAAVVTAGAARFDQSAMVEVVGATRWFLALSRLPSVTPRRARAPFTH